MASQTGNNSVRLARRVLLIGWDAADWKLIDPLLEQGRMPHLAKFIDAGLMGNVASLTPMLSPMLWTSIATGKYADRHGILGFAEPDPQTGKVRPVTSTSRQCRALWNILSERGLRSGVVNWFASHPPEPIHGFVVTDRYAPISTPPEAQRAGAVGSVYPPELLALLEETRVELADTTPAQVAPFIPRVAELDPAREERLAHLRFLLAQGATIHAAATRLMVEQEWDFLGIYYDSIDRFGHAFMEYHPPRMPQISERDYEHYKEVMTGCYVWHDMMLGRLLELAGDDTTVIIVSDHGFHSDHLRPAVSSRIQGGRPVAWHRPLGVLAIKGPRLRRDERIYGASLLDITPTILWLLGCPVAKDMDGSPLIQIAEQPPASEEVPSVDTYETGEAKAAAPAADEDAAVTAAMLERLADLGYIERDAKADEVVLERHQNLGQVYASSGRPGLALTEFEHVLQARPDDEATLQAMAGCLLQLGRLEECEAKVRQVLAGGGDAPRANLMLGMIEFRRGHDEPALAYLHQAEAACPDLPGLQCQIGNVYLRRQRLDDAEHAFEQALAIDPQSPEAHDGMGIVHRQRGRLAEAVRSHMEAIALLHYRPLSHLNLGLALAELGRIRWALRAFHVAADMNPHDPLAHRCLAELYEKAVKDPAKAERHRETAQRLRAERDA